MARLPQPGGDNGNWGQILNEYLAQSHNSDGTLKNGTVSAATIQDGSITESQLTSAVQTKLNAVGSGSVADGTITTAKLADGAVTGAKLADSAVTTAKVNDNAITSAKVADNAVTSTKLTDGAVTSAKIADGTIVDADISASAAIAQSKISNLTASLTAKAPLASPTFTGTVSLPALTVTGGTLAAGRVLTSDASGNATWQPVGSAVIPADMSMVVFGKDSVRTVGTGDNPFGVKVQRSLTIQAVTARVLTADASGSMSVELRKNGGLITGTGQTIPAASQVSGTSVTGLSATCVEGDIITAYITATGTSPGKGLAIDIKAVCN